MSRDIGRWRALANAGFVVLVLALGGFGLYQVAGRRWHVQPVFHVRATFATVAGLEAGHRVRLQGMDAGVVEQLNPPGSPGEPVGLVLRLDERLHGLVREDAVARILSEGMVGARVVEITPGKPDAAVVAEGGSILSEAPIELSDLLRQAGDSLKRLDEVAKAARTGLDEVNAIAATVRQGKGSLGKLVRDEEAYQSLMTVTHRGERTFAAMEDNLDALKRTWPLSRYFEGRSFYEREKILYQPGARRESRTLAADDLFEPGRAILTQDGRLRLNELGAWCKASNRARSDVVIAAFTGPDQDPDLAEVLTQEQADAVRKYLVEKHGIDSAGWFKSRKVTAVGFGTQVPRGQEPTSESLPARRVDVILFTPQA
ncbi:OmpA family protein [Aquisphaera giovannonii]|uniref:OmpA family protein n=1 Tax=Aquisphaera giovannonii TaxID=406548 RepID=A0A5B9W379_9BACT|nr:MlaD family protein [Aquisphaera giovannonii]QEH34694.1 OmpA family protein [Aquisphaera giovannonii]